MDDRLNVHLETLDAMGLACSGDALAKVYLMHMQDSCHPPLAWTFCGARNSSRDQRLDDVLF